MVLYRYVHRPRTDDSLPRLHLSTDSVPTGTTNRPRVEQRDHTEAVDGHLPEYRLNPFQRFSLDPWEPVPKVSLKRTVRRQSDTQVVPFRNLQGSPFHPPLDRPLFPPPQSDSWPHGTTPYPVPSHNSTPYPRTTLVLTLSLLPPYTPMTPPLLPATRVTSLPVIVRRPPLWRTPTRRVREWSTAHIRLDRVTTHYGYVFVPSVGRPNDRESTFTTPAVTDVHSGRWTRTHLPTFLRPSPESPRGRGGRRTPVGGTGEGRRGPSGTGQGVRDGGYGSRAEGGLRRTKGASQTRRPVSSGASLSLSLTGT